MQAPFHREMLDIRQRWELICLSDFCANHRVKLPMMIAPPLRPASPACGLFLSSDNGGFPAAAEAAALRLATADRGPAGLLRQDLLPIHPFASPT
jgi:hypothetical protein